MNCIYFRPSGEFDKPYLIVLWITSDDREHLNAVVREVITSATLCLDIFCTTLKGFIFDNCFS